MASDYSGPDLRISRIHDIQELRTHFNDDVSADFQRICLSVDEVKNGEYFSKKDSKTIEFHEKYSDLLDFLKNVFNTDEIDHLVKYQSGKEAIISIEDNEGIDKCVVSVDFNDTIIFLESTLQNTKKDLALIHQWQISRKKQDQNDHV